MVYVVLLFSSRISRTSVDKKWLGCKHLVVFYQHIAHIMETNRLIKVDQLNILLEQLVRPKGIDYKFVVEEKERKDVDRCFMMLRDMAGYVKEKLLSIEENQAIIGDSETCDTFVETKEDGQDHYNYGEGNDIDILNEMSEEKPVQHELNKKHLNLGNRKNGDERPAKKVKVATKTLHLAPAEPQNIQNKSKMPSQPLQSASNGNIFKSEWMDPKNLLFDINGDRLSDYLAPVDSSPSEAFCRACNCNFSVAMKGVGQVYQHARGAGHKKTVVTLR